MVHPALTVIRDKVADRVAEISGPRPWWPCAEGCDTCCRRLAEEPRFTSAEWSELRAALDRLSADVRTALDARVRALAASPTGDLVVCPLLNETRGTCRVYDARPVACRTYAFYVSRAADLRCSKVESALAEHEPDARVVWGNQAAVDRRLESEFGPARPLTDWWATTR